MAYSDVYSTTTGIPRDAFMRDKVHERPAIQLQDPVKKDEEEMTASFKILLAMAALLLLAVIGCIVLGSILYKQGYGSMILYEVNGTAYAHGPSAQVACPPCRLDDLMWNVQCPPCGTEMEGCPPCKPWMEKIVCPKCARVESERDGQCPPCVGAVRDCPACDDSNQCSTPQCLRDAARIKESLNTDVDPCDNFFEFACGNWLRANPAPYGVNRWETTKKLEMDTMERARKVLEGPVERVNETSSERKMKDFHQTCITGRLSEREEKAGLRRMIHKIGGWAGYPEHITLDDQGFDGESWNLQKAIQVVTFDLKADVLFQPFLNYDDAKSTVQLELMAAVTHDCSKTKEEQRYLYRLAEILDPTSEPYRFVDAVIETQAEICQATSHIETNGLSNVTVREMQESFSEVSDVDKWQYEELKKLSIDQYITLLLEQINWLQVLRYRYGKIELNTKIIIFGFEQMRAMARVMETMNRRDLRDYFTHVAIKEHMSLMLPQLQDAYFDYNQGYMMKQDPSVDDCVQEVARSMPFALLAELDKDKDPDGYHSVINDEQLQELKHNVRDTIIYRMSKVEWLKDDLKRKFKRKIKNTKVILGAPQWIRADDQLDAFYLTLEVNRSSTYLENHVSMRTFRDALLAQEYGKNGVDELYWRLFVRQPRVFAANARNYVAKGALAIYPSMLLPPFYGTDSALYLNYGGLGYILAHEFGHYFDGINSDAWINMSSIRPFEKRARCLREYFTDIEYQGYSPCFDAARKVLKDHYFEYVDCRADEFPDLITLPYPNKTEVLRHAQQQGIADISGLKWAFEAYQFHTRKMSVQRLAGLPYTPEQLFFISAAQVWCVKEVKPDTDVVKTRGIRLLGMIGQSKMAGEAFNCPRGSMTQPRRDCGFW